MQSNHDLTLNLNELEYNPILGICINPYPQYLTWGIDKVNFARDEDLIKEEPVVPKSQLIKFDYLESPKKNIDSLQLVPALTCMKPTCADSEHSFEIDSILEDDDFVDQILYKNDDHDQKKIQIFKIE